MVSFVLDLSHTADKQSQSMIWGGVTTEKLYIQHLSGGSPILLPQMVQIVQLQHQEIHRRMNTQARAML